MKTGLAALGVAGILFVGGCSSSGTAESPTAEATGSWQEMTAGKVVIDVRTPEEYATGHAQGAENINLNSGNFEAEVSQLDPNKTYVVYCRSGSRSAQAAAIMQDQGLTVIDAGGLADIQGAGAQLVS